MIQYAKITVKNVWCRLTGVQNVEIIDKLDQQLSYFVEGYKFTKAYNQGWYDRRKEAWIQWDGKKHLLTQNMTFPIGLLEHVKRFLRLNDVPFKVEDNRKEIKNTPIEITAYKPRYYQAQAAEIAMNKGRGIIRVATSGGKTLISSMIAAQYNVPSMIYVVGKDLLYQFYEDTKKCLGEENVGIIGDGKVDIRKFNICSVWTAARAFELKSKISLDDEDWSPDIVELNNETKKEIKRAVQSAVLTIFDEAHFLACDTIQSIFKAGKSCNYSFGLSGTDWRDDGADLLLESVCGPRIYDISASTLIKEGYIVQPKIALIDVPVNKEIRKSMRYQQIYSMYVTNNKLRNELIVDSAKKLIKMGRKVLILIRYIKHGNIIVDMLKDFSVIFVKGDLAGEERAEIKNRFEDGEIQCLVASSVFDIGVNIPSLDALILAGGGKSSVRTLQRIGRVMRRGGENKNDAIVVDFIDNAKYLDKHSATRIAIYESEPGFKIKFPKNFNKARLKRPSHIPYKIR